MRHKAQIDYRQVLKSAAWETPSSYDGFSPIGDYCILTQHRDSDALDRSNWEVAHTELPEEVKAYAPTRDSGTFLSLHDAPIDDFADRPNIYTWEASHCMVGWVQYLMVRADAPEEVLIAAANIVDSIEQYPALNDDHWSQLEDNEACEWWASMDIRGRMEILEGSGVSMFAARRDYPPDDDSGYVRERLRA